MALDEITEKLSKDKDELNKWIGVFIGVLAVFRERLIMALSSVRPQLTPPHGIRRFVPSSPLSRHI